MATVIEMHHVFKTYGKGQNLVHALSDVSLTIGQGEFVSILGPSGSGKSTLMNILGLIDSYDSGEYFLDGIDIGKKAEKLYAEIRNRKIGFVFQKYNLISKYTALHNVALPLILRGEKSGESRKKAMEMLKMVGLEERWHHLPNQLSGGQQQRVAIARALVGDGTIILADEPTGNLDRKTGADIMDLFLQLNQKGKTIVLITHDPGIAEKAGRILHVEDGALLENR